MEFSSICFLWVFLPATLIIYYALRLIKKKELSESLCNYFLLAASLVFYAWGGFSSLAIILALSLLNYAAGILFEKSGYKKAVLTAAIAADLLILILFKYSGMFTSLTGILAGAGRTGLRDTVMQLLTFSPGTSSKIPAMPLAISFVVFQSIAYLADIGRGQIPAEYSLPKYLLFIFLFPQILQGPIMRYRNLGGQITVREHRTASFANGARRFICGLGKKVIIANTLAAVIDGVWEREVISLSTGISISTAEAWLASVFFLLQLYYDFSGYSDMAVGIGQMFGFRIDENFNYPYLSLSVKEFWRRWHITLSSWFRDYVYIPLGGSRKGTQRTLLNLFIVFLLTGIWHGANLTFLVWGILNAAALIIERIFLGRILEKNPVKLLNRVYTLLFVNLFFVFFRAPNTFLALRFLRTMFVFSPAPVNTSLLSYISIDVIAAFLAGVLCCGPAQSLLRKRIAGRFPAARDVFLLAVFAWSILLILAGSYNPSIYAAF